MASGTGHSFGVLPLVLYTNTWFVWTVSCTVQYCAVLYGTVLVLFTSRLYYGAGVLFCNELLRTVLYCTRLCITELYCTVLKTPLILLSTYRFVNKLMSLSLSAPKMISNWKTGKQRDKEQRQCQINETLSSDCKQRGAQRVAPLRNAIPSLSIFTFFLSFLWICFGAPNSQGLWQDGCRGYHSGSCLKCVNLAPQR